MHNHETLIQNFYAAFQQKDYRAMQHAYHQDATFSDPVFGSLDATQTKAMWKMLTTSAKDLKVVCSEIKADDARGSCRWDAWYTFSGTGRKVHNIIHAKFVFKDGKIIAHDDHFSFWRWSRMALGTAGVLMGWSPYLLNAVREKVRKRLEKFIQTDV